MTLPVSPLIMSRVLGLWPNLNWAVLSPIPTDDFWLNCNIAVSSLWISTVDIPTLKTSICFNGLLIPTPSWLVTWSLLAVDIPSTDLLEVRSPVVRIPDTVSPEILPVTLSSWNVETPTESTLPTILPSTWPTTLPVRLPVNPIPAVTIPVPWALVD